jgi:hypothetical protein
MTGNVTVDAPSDNGHDAGRARRCGASRRDHGRRQPADGPPQRLRVRLATRRAPRPAACGYPAGPTPRRMLPRAAHPASIGMTPAVSGRGGRHWPGRWGWRTAQARQGWVGERHRPVRYSRNALIELGDRNGGAITCPRTGLKCRQKVKNTKTNGPTPACCCLQERARPPATSAPVFGFTRPHLCGLTPPHFSLPGPIFVGSPLLISPCMPVCMSIALLCAAFGLAVARTQNRRPKKGFHRWLS